MPQTFKEVLVGVGFEIGPKVVGAVEEGDVVGVFEIPLADDAGLAVGAAAVVGDVELFEAEDVGAALGEMVDRGGTHAAEADDDDVVRGHGEEYSNR